MHWHRFLFLAALFGMAGIIPVQPARASAAAPPPLSAFEENGGQFDASVHFVCRTSTYTAFLTDAALVVRMESGMAETAEVHRFPGRIAAAHAQGRLAASGHYFSAGRQIAAALYTSLLYPEVEPGVDFMLYCGSAGLEYERTSRYGPASPGSPLPWEGAGELLRLRQDSQAAPAHSKAPARRLATVGGTLGESAYGVAVAGDGSVYIAGETWSADFPSTLQTSYRAHKDVFVAKLNSTADTLLYSVVIGGTLDDSAKSIAVDANGNVVVAGTTDSFNFPVTSAAAARAYSGARDAFVVKLNASGSQLLYSTYLGGSGEDSAAGIALDAAGAAYVTGYTSSRQFPVTPGVFQAVHGGGVYDTFIAKLNPSGTAYTYSLLLGGAGNDIGRGIAVDAAGCAYLTGSTDSVNFRVKSAFQGAPAGGGDAYLTKINASGSDIVYSTYLGGRGVDYGVAVAVDAGGTAYVAGATSSDLFPIAGLALQPTRRGEYDAFVAKFGPAGNTLTAGTYLGGSASEEPAGIALDANGFIYVDGYTRSGDFLAPHANVWPYRGGEDAFLVRVSNGLDTLSYGGCLGGGGDDRATGIAVLPWGQVFVAGRSNSTDFSERRIGPGGGGDAFVIPLGTVNRPPYTASVSPSTGIGLQSTFTFTVGDPDGAADLFGMMILITPNGQSQNACVLLYERSSGVVALADNAVAQFPYAGRVGTAAVLENSQCAISLQNAAVAASGANISLTLPVAFKSSFTGQQTVYLFTQDRAGAYAGWDARGTWTVGQNNHPPSTLPVMPADGSGASQTFVFRAADPDGATDMFGMMILISPTGASTNACVLFYDRSAGIIALADDAMTQFPWAGQLGSSGLIENGQCLISLTGASVSAVGTDLSLVLPITFKKSFAGRKMIYVFTQDRSGAFAGWDMRGAWSVPAGNRNPVTVGVTPTAGTGTSQTFTFTVADADGAAELSGMMIMISPTGSNANACVLFYDRSAGVVALANDAVTQFPWAAHIGTAADIANNQCSVALAGASAVSAGSRLSLSLPITFKNKFRGPQFIFLFAQDAAGYAGWDLRGSWNVP